MNWEPSPGLNVNFDVSNEIPSHITYARSNLTENIYARVNFNGFSIKVILPPTIARLLILLV